MNIEDEIFEEIEKPIGSFILENNDIKLLMTANGAYYHYSQVCTLLDRLKKLNSEPNDKVIATQQAMP